MSDNSNYLKKIVDRESLAEYLEARLGPADEFQISRHEQGHSNETLFLDWGEDYFVIRRPPPGATADTAHDVLREYRVITRLQDTHVRVPKTVLACEDHSVMGCDFYIVERERGDVPRGGEPARFQSPDHRERIGSELVRQLATIHAVDYAAVGLDEIGKPEGYTTRQVERWHAQFEWAFEVTEPEREIPAVDEVAGWLDDEVPGSHQHTLVHGDYKLDNVMFGLGTPPELTAVFDWEMSTLGDPLTDLGWLLIYWQDDAETDPPVPELMPTFLDREGYPSRREIVDRYEAVSGREFTNERFYRVLALYKLAALCEMFFRRHLEGNSDDPLYPKMRSRVPALIDQAVRVIDGDDLL